MTRRIKERTRASSIPPLIAAILFFLPPCAACGYPTEPRIAVTETLALPPGDKVWVVLRSPDTELQARAGLFDLVTLERLSR